jgi:DNA ligase-associated metallophosphoesterase
MVRFSFCGHELMALPQGALFWPARQALLVADLHLEKASWFARLGQMLPPYDSVATLADLTALVAATAPREIWCLGDSFHDRHGCDRLPDQARAMLTGLTATIQWTWITGNHDPGFADHCGGTIVDEAEVDGLVLRHEASPGEVRPELSGHFHPKLRITHRGRQVSRRCFIRHRSQAGAAGLRCADRWAGRQPPGNHPRRRRPRPCPGPGRRPPAPLPGGSLEGDGAGLIT